MEFKFPVVQANGKEFTAEELYGKLSQEDSGYYLLSANKFWHGGVHFTSKNFAQHITDVPIQAIAKGTVIAYRINKDYLLIEDNEVLAVPPEKGGYQYSSGFCLIKHSIPYERKKTEQEKQQEIQQQVQQTTEQLKDQQITVQGSSPRTYRNEEGTKATSAGTYPVGTKLDIISISDTAKDGYYFAKVREAGKTATSDEHYIALLNKEGKPLANKDGKAFFELPESTPETPSTSQQTATNNNDQAPADNTQPTNNTNTQQPTTFNLEFYSLYMHLCAYDDYLPKKENEQQQKPETITINASGLRVRDKQRDEANCAVLGSISNGATLEVLESKVSNNKQFTDVKGKIISGTVKNGNNEIAKAGDTVWVPTKQGNKSFIKDNKQQIPKEKTRPSYWQGTVTAKVKKADGITIWKTCENNELKTELGKINQGNQFTFDSTQAKTISQTGKPDLLVAECTAIGTFSFRGNGEQPAGTFWTTVDKDSITREKVEPTVFDTVVPCQVEVIAGESLGYLGIYETPSKMCEINKKRQVHVEIFTPNLATVEFLLNNPFKLAGKKYIKLAKGTQLLGLLPADRPAPALPTQTTTPAPQASPIPDYTVTRDHYLAIDTLETKKQLNGKEWYKIAVEQHTGYLAKEGLEEIDQHEWAKLGFQLVQEANTNADGYLDPNLMPPIFQQIYNKIDTSGDGKLQQSELKAALQNQEIRDQWSKLIAYHPSEWRTDIRAIIARFTQLLTNALAPSDEQAKASKLLLQETQRMATLPFLEQVTPPIAPMLYHFHPVAFVEHLKTVNSKAQIIFPLKVKPKNDKEGVWKNYYWAAKLSDSNASQAIFGRNRSGGTRKHAARDLYTNPLTEIVAICDGEVKAISPYYYGTWQITIKHETNDGRKFFIRYGEVDSNSINVKVEDKVKQGKVIAKTGLMINPKTNKHPNIIPGETVYMIHFEYYTGSESLESVPPNNSGGTQPPYDRRKDIHDPLDILEEGYKNTFENGAGLSDNNRIDINQLQISEKGKEFIKEWEGFHSKAYNDSEGYCTIGYGHLIEKKKCENITLPSEFKNGITKQRANQLFESRLPDYVQGVKDSVVVKLHQYEFDALVCLLFNLGATGLKTKAPMLRRKLNSGDYEGAAKEFLDITNGGTVGLVKRRESENNLFLNNIYDASH